MVSVSKYCKTRKKLYSISFLISIYHYPLKNGFLSVSTPSSWVENVIKRGVCPLSQNLALCLAAIKIKRRFLFLLYFHVKLLCKLWWSKLTGSMLFPSPFCIQTWTIYYPPSPKNEICYTTIIIYWQFWRVMLLTTVYCVCVYSISACLSTELKGVVETTYFIYSLVFKIKDVWAKTILRQRFATFVCTWKYIHHIYFRFTVRSSFHNSYMKK